MNLYDKAHQMIKDMYGEAIGTNPPKANSEQVASLLRQLEAASQVLVEYKALMQKSELEREGRRGISAMSKLFAESVLRERDYHVRMRELAEVLFSSPEDQK